MNPIDILQQYWGYRAFRPLQEDIIQSVLNGGDTLALLPTGGGKSVCFQVPALCREGICIVVSPLIALMKDQVYQLHKRNIPAAAIYSGMSRRELDIVFENACQGAYKFLYVSPERLRTDLAQARIKRMKVNLLAIDEAHCISQWGYDFRPPYLQIADLRLLLPDVPVLALTATATPEVVEDIQTRLAFKQKNVFQQSFLRSNLSYSVLYETKKYDKMLDILQRVPGTGIVYTRSRGEAKNIAQLLNNKGLNAGFYHAGLTSEERSTRQEAWISGKTRIIVCTNAFGMGIDKPDVRVVVHLMPPDSIEAYFQEAGRAGRDGKKSYSVLLFDGENDPQALRFFVQNAFPAFDVVRRVYQALGSHSQLAVGSGLGESIDFDLEHFCIVYKLEQPTVHVALKLLEQEGWISLSEPAAMPPRIQITASREVLYDYQLRHKQADTIFKALLRAYPGIQQDFVEISESVIASWAKISTEQVVKMLENFQKEDLLLYLPRNDKSKITFTRERASAENLTIDLEKFNFRRRNAEERVERSIQYAETRRCRSQQLLAYFGEKNSVRCGICDVCTGRNESDIPSELYHAYTKKIKEVLRHEALPFEEILKAFAAKRHETVGKVLGLMLDEGVVKEQENGLFQFTI